MTEQSVGDESAKHGAQQAGGKKRLVVLGGGPSALTALYWITSRPETREAYDITVYQMGWRLGGKGASGREEHGRILEHGLHVLFGFYDNFFHMIRGCYDELGRPADHPLATWRDAFKPHNFAVEEDYFDGSWHPWVFQFPSNGSEPGDPGTFDEPVDYVSMCIQGLLELILGWRALYDLDERSSIFNAHGEAPHRSSWSDAIVNWLMRRLERPLRAALAHELAKGRHSLASEAIAHFQRWLWPLIRRFTKHSVAGRRFWFGVDFMMALTRGIIDDGVFEKGGFNRIDEYDFREWLTRNGIHETTLPSPYCRTVYDAAFSYKLGDPNDQRVAAGAACRGFLRTAFTYKGSVYYKMQAGMGDTVFAPMYEVLKRRGVKFQFFHKVDSLHLSDGPVDGDEKIVSSIRMTQQAFLECEAPGSGDTSRYEPLETIVDLPCWPAKPRYGQLRHADELAGHDLESYYDPLPPEITRSVELRAGEDYDEILYAIPIGAVPYVCSELVEDSDRWAQMVDKVESVTTVAFQLWFERDLEGLGWKLPSPLLSLYVEPLNTWADMSQVIPREAWPAGQGPKNISYYCGAQRGPKFAPDPRDPANADFETENFARAKELSIEFCRASLTQLMPDAVDPEIPPQIDWNVLVDLKGGEGVERFDSQYWRSNCGPSERCTLALPGATKHRIKADETGYGNLRITGDWIDNGIYMACMEGAITSGVYGARAVTGIRYPIIGEDVDAM